MLCINIYLLIFYWVGFLQHKLRSIYTSDLQSRNISENSPHNDLKIKHLNLKFFDSLHHHSQQYLDLEEI